MSVAIISQVQSRETSYGNSPFSSISYTVSYIQSTVYYEYSGQSRYRLQSTYAVSKYTTLQSTHTTHTETENWWSRVPYSALGEYSTVLVLVESSHYDTVYSTRSTEWVQIRDREYRESTERVGTE